MAIPLKKDMATRRRLEKATPLKMRLISKIDR